MGLRSQRYHNLYMFFTRRHVLAPTKKHGNMSKQPPAGDHKYYRPGLLALGVRATLWGFKGLLLS